MYITWYGQACFKIEATSHNESVAIIIDPFDPSKTGLTLPRTLNAEIVLTTGLPLAYPVVSRTEQAPFIISGPGEYEVQGIFIKTIPLSSPESAQNYLFWIEVENMILVHTGALQTVPTETELQEIDDLDVLFIPVGGKEVLDSKAAARLVNELEPRLVIPMYYKLPGLKSAYDDVGAFVRAIGAKSETFPKFKLTKKELPVDQTKVVVLEKT